MHNLIMFYFFYIFQKQYISLANLVFQNLSAHKVLDFKFSYETSYDIQILSNMTGTNYRAVKLIKSVLSYPLNQG